ncbi:MAG: multidrug effflux MFS transporter [Beutenbergiaceae bacterium]
MTNPEEPADPPSRPPAGAALTVLLAALTMIGPFTIDTIFPAFTQIGEQFAVNATALQQVTSSYLLAFAVMSVFHGPLSDALGRKPVMIAGLAGYVLASIGCALSPNLGVLLIMRTLQGVFAGAATIVSRVVVRDIYAGPQAHRMMSRIMMIFSVAPAVAPVMGGLLLQVGTWPIIFWAVAGYGLLSLLAVVLVLPETHPATARSTFSARSILRSILTVGRSPVMIRLATITALSMGGQFLYIMGAPIIVVDLLGLGEQDFWVLFVPVIGGLLVGSWLSGHLAGSMRRERLIDAALAATVVAGVANVVIVMVTPHLPWAMVGPGLLAGAIAVAFPAIQLEILDSFPANRGAAASLGTFGSLAFNAVIAGIIAPMVGLSLMHVAVTALVFVTLGAMIWAGHRRVGRRARGPQTG